MGGELAQELFFLLRMQVGLLDGAASVAYGAVGAPRSIGAELVRLCVRMVEDFPGLEIEKFLVAGILQHQCFFPIADDDPIALPDLQLGHEICPPRLSRVLPKALPAL